MTVRYRLRGDLVRQALAEAHLTIGEGARRLGISRSYLSQLLAGARNPSPRLRRRLTSRTPFSRLPETDLLERIDDAPPTS